MTERDGEHIEERRDVLRAEGAKGTPLDPAVIGAALADDDWRVRKDAAALAAERIADPGIVEIVVRRPNDKTIRAILGAPRGKDFEYSEKVPLPDYSPREEDTWELDVTVSPAQSPDAP